MLQTSAKRVKRLYTTEWGKGDPLEILQEICPNNKWYMHKSDSEN